MAVKVLHITLWWGEGKGGVKSFIATLLGGCSDAVEQSVLTMGRIVGDAPAAPMYGPIINTRSAYKLTFSGKKLTAFLKAHPHDVVHIHTNNSLGFKFADCARRAGVPMRIVHSHNSTLGSAELPKVLMNKALDLRYRRSATDRWACSDLAGKHLFGNDPFVKVNNAVDAERFAYSDEARERVRAELGIGADELVAVHVGAGIPAKNTCMTLRILDAARKRGQRIRLILLGSGPEIDDVRALCRELDLDDQVFFAGFTDAPEDFYCAADAMLAPSLFEGLPICVVEAQANALPILMSDAVSSETALTDIVRSVSLDEGEAAWADALASLCESRADCVAHADDYVSDLREQGFTADSLCAFVTSEYLRFAERM